VTRLVHGDAAVVAAEEVSRALFSERITSLTLDQIRQSLANVPSLSVVMRVDGWPVVDLLSDAGIAKSKSDATRLIRGGGIYVNERRVTDERERLSPDDAIEGQLFVVRKGKKDYFLIRIAS
jgi:tyrosyl-tRNA synthetase